MNLTADQQREYSRFPAALRAIVEAELAAGNAIASIECGFPAAPCGASIVLAKAVREAHRRSAGDVVFYERNTSRYNGEFTTAERHFFVLEPPLPPPPDPDMDAIRRAFESKPGTLEQLAERQPGTWTHNVAATPSCAPKSSNESDWTPAGRAANEAITASETSTSRVHLLHFRDRRPPHEVQFALERELATLFTQTIVDDRLTFHAMATVVGADYEFELQFVTTFPSENRYSLRIEVSWAKFAPTQHDYYRTTSASWIAMWTRDLMAANPPAAHRHPTARYRELCQLALEAEAHLDSVAAIQRAILVGLERGGRYSTSHKEGGTNIYWREDHFVRSDYGEDPAIRTTRDEAEFLALLWNFCQSDGKRHAGTKGLSEFDTWKLILRRMLPS